MHCVAVALGALCMLIWGCILLVTSLRYVLSYSKSSLKMNVCIMGNIIIRLCFD